MMILVLSLLFAIWARITLGKNWSGAIQTVKGQSLIHSGPYRVYIKESWALIPYIF